MNKITLHKNKAIILRQQGLLYSQIADQLGIAKSTAYLWTRDIEFTAQGKRIIEDRRRTSRLRAAAVMAQAKLTKSAVQDAVALDEARDTVNNFDAHSSYGKILCAALFWCEGQTSVTSGVRFINSDPRMIRLFLKLLRENFELDESRFRALVHLHDYHDELKQLVFWSDVTGIPLAQFHKSYRKLHTGKNKREGYPGCISIRYGDSTLGKRLKMIYSMLGENA